MILSISLCLCSNVAYAAPRDLKPTEAYVQKLIKEHERQNNIPAGLMLAIARVESGYKPFSINLAGNSYFPSSPREAVSLIKKAIEEGITNVDIGIMQLNYRWHQENFNSIEEMLSPEKNIAYAGRLLTKLYKRHGDWHKAIRYYHSANAMHHRKYSRKVVIEWLKYI